MLKNNFDQIYQAALDQDADILKKIISETCIDVWKIGRDQFSAVSALAFENKIPAVKFLLKHGANINYAAYGAAIGGHWDYIFKILPRVDISWVARGAAEGRHRQQTELFLAMIVERVSPEMVKGNESIRKIYNNMLTEIAVGAILGGDIDVVSKYKVSILSGSLRKFVELYNDANNWDRLLPWLVRSRILRALGFNGNIDEYLLRIPAKKFYSSRLGYLIQGAAQGGHWELVNKLFNKVDYQERYVGDLLSGLCLGGHGAILESLINTGVTQSPISLLFEIVEMDFYQFNDNSVFLPGHGHETLALCLKFNQVSKPIFQYAGLIDGGHIKMIEKILLDMVRRRDSDLEGLIISIFGNYSISKPENQVAFITQFNPTVLPIMINFLPSLKSEKKRLLNLSVHIHNKGLSYEQALIKTDCAFEGMLYLLMIIQINQYACFEKLDKHLLEKHLVPLPLEIWTHIFNFITPLSLYENDINELGFVMCRNLLSAELLSYPSEGKHGERVNSFNNAIKGTKNKEELTLLVNNQTRILQGKNPYSLFRRELKYKTNTQNSTVDKYHKIIGFWHHTLSGEQVHFVETNWFSNIANF
jgi:hypothetical protein